eukprot:gene25816-11491_t
MRLMNGSRSANPAFVRSRQSLSLSRARPVARAASTAEAIVPEASQVEASGKINAVVSSLFGRPRWGSDSCVVPVLSSDLGLPFGLSLEIVTDDEIPEKSVAQDSTQGRLLDLCYVLSGYGLIEADDGSSRVLRAGDALLAWHGTTRMCKTGSEPLSVLLYHLPSHLLARSTPSQSSIMEQEELTQLLHNFNQRYATEQGECFTTDEADQIMQAARVQASHGISKLYKEGDEAAESSPSANASSTAESSPSNSANGGLDSALMHNMFQMLPWPGSNNRKLESQQLEPQQVQDTFQTLPWPSRISELKNSLSGMLSPRQRDAELSLGSPGLANTHILGAEAAFNLPSSSSLAAFLNGSAWTNTLMLPLAGLASSPTGQVDSLSGSSSSSRVGGMEGSASASNMAEQSADTSYFASSAAFEDGGSGCLLMQRAMEHFRAFRFPHQTNRLAFVFDPSEVNLSVSFGIEVFEPGHKTPIHVHPTAHEVFFCLAVSPGDVIVFPPTSKHALDNLSDSKLYCLQLMAPNEQFVEFVKSGEPIGRLSDDDLCTLANLYC